MRCLVTKLGADINQLDNAGHMPLCEAVLMNDFKLVKCMVEEFGADVNQADTKGLQITPLFNAAQGGKLDVVRYLLKSSADINHACGLAGVIPLMVASMKKHSEVVKWLVKAGADTQAIYVRPDGISINAAAASRIGGASAEQTAYLEDKTHCSNPGCSGAGLLKCTGCKQARYCRQERHRAHWKAHKADCKRWSVKLGAIGKGKGGGNYK
jgi:hypothetical protein